jgi:hypothetical protein
VICVEYNDGRVSFGLSVVRQEKSRVRAADEWPGSEDAGVRRADALAAAYVVIYQGIAGADLSAECGGEWRSGGTGGAFGGR